MTGSDIFVSAGLGLRVVVVQEVEVHNLSLLHINTGFIFSRSLWFQGLICPGIGGLYRQFPMANGTPDRSLESLGPVDELKGQATQGI